MNGLLLSLLLAWPAAAAEGRKAPEPLPATPPEEDYRVVVDESSEPKEAEEAPAVGRPGVKRRGVWRLSSVDVKEKRIVLEHEDGEEETFVVPDTARLSFAAEERPLKLDQLRRGDAVAYAVDGGKATRLHLDLCGNGSGSEDDFFAPPTRRGRQKRPPPPPPPDDGPEYPDANEPDVPMYQSEPPEAPPAPKKAPKK